MKGKIVIASGYFDPIHEGHIEYLNLARKLGTELIVIVNNDIQSALKSGKNFYNEKERLRIVSNLKSVDKAILSIDPDGTVCKSIEEIVKRTPIGYEFIFAKGGDRYAHEIPEAQICRQYNVKIIDGLGSKIQSSSDILKRYRNKC